MCVGAVDVSILNCIKESELCEFSLILAFRATYAFPIIYGTKSRPIDTPGVLGGSILPSGLLVVDAIQKALLAFMMSSPFPNIAVDVVLDPPPIGPRIP